MGRAVLSRRARKSTARSSRGIPISENGRRSGVIALVTGTRAEFGLLEPVLRACLAQRALKPRLLVTGMHLLPAFGHTIEHIRRNGWTVHATVRMQSGRDDASGEAGSDAPSLP